MEATPSALRERVLVEDGTSVIRPVLGVTAYLADPEAWAREGARAAWELFSKLPRTRALAWATTSAMQTWERWDPRAGERAAEALSSWTWVSDWPRHLLQVQLADLPAVPSVGFTYFEVDPRRTSRSGFLELTFPIDTDASEIEGVVRELLRIGRIHALLAGHSLRWNPQHRRLGLNQSYLWCKRFFGLDLQDPESSSWTVPEFLPGMSWLTALGPALAARVPEAALASFSVARVERVGEVMLLRASALPSLGDRNALVQLPGWVEVSTALAPLFPPESDGLEGAFAAPDHFRSWMLRFVDPAGWSD